MFFPNRQLWVLGFALLAAGGLGLRAAAVWRPIDYTSTSPWRECDLGMIARNFWRGDMNILRPQIDWRGDGPGYVESELPLLAWLMALGYRALGYHEEIGRVLTLSVSLASVAAFHRLARALLPGPEARHATVFFLFSPIMVQMATNIQPDPGMLLCAIICVHAFVRWMREERERDLAVCALSGALAILLKAPAACLGLLLAALCLERFGRGVLKRPRVWLLAAAMALPGIFWYRHARGFWLMYGHSLGISNETHWIGMDLLANPRELARLAAGAARIETVQVFGAAGAILAAAGAWRAQRRKWRILVYWLGAAYAFYLAALRTTGDSWAFYYHGLSVAPACLLMGLGCGRPARAGVRTGKYRLRLRARARILGRMLAVICVGCLGAQAVRSTDLLPPRTGDTVLYPRYTAAEHFTERIGAGELIVTVGGSGVDATGRRVAYDDGTLMFFLDRKGFIIPREEMKVETLRRLAGRGARYLIEKRDSPLAAAARREFSSVAIFGDYELIALKQRLGGSKDG